MLHVKVLLMPLRSYLPHPVPKTKIDFSTRNISRMSQKAREKDPYCRLVVARIGYTPPRSARNSTETIDNGDIVPMVALSNRPD